MEKPTSYCAAVRPLDSTNVHRVYHDTQYGFPIETDQELFGRLILEINQAGLSWTTILNKQDNFRAAYAAFDISSIARFQEEDVHRLLADEGIIRNRLKIKAAIFNANRVLTLQNEFGSFKAWLNHHHPLELAEWVILFKKNFKFTGGEITKAFLVITGYVKGAHEEACAVYQKVLAQNPMWYVKPL